VELDKVRASYRELAREAREDLRSGKLDTGVAQLLRK